MEYLLQAKKIPEVTEISVILDDLQQDILRNAISLYAKELYKIRRTQSVPLNVEQIENILKGLFFICNLFLLPHFINLILSMIN